jgi:hypothetical protein
MFCASTYHRVSKSPQYINFSPRQVSSVKQVSLAPKYYQNCAAKVLRLPSDTATASAAGATAASNTAAATATKRDLSILHYNYCLLPLL